LIWTTTPWTLVSNALVAVHADLGYVTATDGEETLVVAASLVEKALGDGWTVQDTLSGADMVGWTYQRPFELVEWPAGPQGGGAHYVGVVDSLSVGDGRGLSA